MFPACHMRRPMGYGGYYQGMGTACGSNSPYKSVIERQRQQNSMKMAILTAAAAQKHPAQQTRHFGRSHRWGTSQYFAGRPARHFQYLFRSAPRRYMRTSVGGFSQAAQRPSSHPFTAMHRPNLFRPGYAPHYSSAYAKFASPLLSRGYPPPRGVFEGREPYYTRTDGDDDDDPFADDDDDDWGDTDPDSTYDWDGRSGNEDADDYYDDYSPPYDRSTRRTPYSTYRPYFPRYDDYGGDDYGDLDSRRYYSSDHGGGYSSGYSSGSYGRGASSRFAQNVEW